MANTDGNFLTGTIELRIGDKQERLQTTLPRGDVSFAAILPLARQIADSVVTWAVAETEAKGKSISCRAGCGACCRQAVPIGHAEARRLSALVQELPEERRSIVQARFGEAMARLRETDLLERQPHLAPLGAKEGMEQRLAWSRDYFHLKIACPLLEDEACSIHPERPLICREYLVTNPASACATLSNDRIERIPLRASVSQAARKVGNEGRPTEWIPLTTALEWVAANPVEGEERPALDWARELQRALSYKSDGGEHEAPETIQ